jgi:hypothetical protein
MLTPGVVVPGRVCRKCGGKIKCYTASRARWSYECTECPHAHTDLNVVGYLEIVCTPTPATSSKETPVKK